MKPVTTNDDLARLSRVFDHLARHLDGELGIAELAAVAASTRRSSRRRRCATTSASAWRRRSPGCPTSSGSSASAADAMPSTD